MAGSRARPRTWAPATIAAASGCSLPCSSDAASLRTSPFRPPVGRLDQGQAGPPLRQGARLVHDQRVHLLEGFERFRVADQDTEASAPPHPDHDRHGRGETQGAWAGDDQDAHGRHEAVGETRLGTHQGPHDEADRGDCDDTGHEVRGDAVREPLDGRSASLGLAHHADDLGEKGVGAHAVGPNHQRAGSIESRPGDTIAGGLLQRDRLPAHHGFVDGAATLDDDAIDGNLLAGADAQPVTRLHAVEGDVGFAPVGSDQPRGLRSQAKKRSDGAARAAAGA